MSDDIKAVRRAKAARDRANEQLQHEIVRAFHFRSAYGGSVSYTVDDIAQAAGLSRARIYQLVDEAKDES